MSTRQDTLLSSRGPLVHRQLEQQRPFHPQRQWTVHPRGKRDEDGRLRAVRPVVCPRRVDRLPLPKVVPRLGAVAGVCHLVEPLSNGLLCCGHPGAEEQQPVIGILGGGNVRDVHTCGWGGAGRDVHHGEQGRDERAEEGGPGGGAVGPAECGCDRKRPDAPPA